ncbi:MAG: hypothetical protein Ct9H300mP28_33590 [Pseudomonadota bacterium]|nr:MAG: hypothetical protein Ct9H300mP28_33590 [Pseudomonadota bacterium]
MNSPSQFPKKFKGWNRLANHLGNFSSSGCFHDRVFFETKLETRGIQNYQASFKARNAVKSMFKAVLEGLESPEEIKFFRQYVWGFFFNWDLRQRNINFEPPLACQITCRPNF